MVKLEETSAYLTEYFFVKVLDKLQKDGVNMQGNKLVGYKSFVSANDCNTCQIVFLNQNIPRGLFHYLKQFGAELRCEFLGVNTHPHATVMTKKDYSKLSEEDRKKIRDEFREQIVNIQVIGIVALSEKNGVILGLEINLDTLNKLRKKLNLSALSNPHISCCFLRKAVYDEKLVSIVLKVRGKEDKYLVWDQGGGTIEIKKGKEEKDDRKGDSRLKVEKKGKRDERKREKTGVMLKVVS